MKITSFNPWNAGPMSCWVANIKDNFTPELEASILNQLDVVAHKGDIVYLNFNDKQRQHVVAYINTGSVQTQIINTVEFKEHKND